MKAAFLVKPRYAVLAALGLTAAACASDPYYASSPRYAPGPSYSSAPAPGPVAYSDYGRVVAIDVVRDGGGHTSGAGAVLGGIAGGVLGHQIGNGRGNDAATVAGAVGGAVVGNEVERRRGEEYYRVTVQFRDGREATFAQDSLNGLRVGDRVRIDGNRLFRD
jgi:outer membrane lipoprotein SlyB